MKILVGLLLLLSLSSGCTSVIVRPVDAGMNLENVCIEENPKVLVGDFLSVVRKGFDRHNINTRVVSRPAPDDCNFLLTYTALMKWDVGTYMHHAELRLEQKGQLIGSAEYHLNGGGGLSLMKWQGTKTKMNPVIDELFANLKK